MKLISAFLVLCLGTNASGFSMSMSSQLRETPAPSRRNFLQTSVTTAAAVAGVSVLPVMPAVAAPEIISTPSGLKYAVLKQPNDPKKAPIPMKGEVVAIEYTGYLSNGKIFDATHSDKSGKALSFRLGEEVVPEGVNEMIGKMGVGEKVQVIVPPKLAFGDKGICLESGECLVKPGSTLVYDIFLKKVAIPPP